MMKIDAQLASGLAWISLGGNLGDPPSCFQRILGRISQISTGEIYQSPLYQTTPWGVTQQPLFFNQIAGFMPQLDPEDTLKWLQAQEALEGRDRVHEERWGPRLIDLDILAWPRYTAHTPALILPHPRLCQRQFVLKPWADVAPDLIPFGLTQSIVELLKQCPDTSPVTQCTDA